MKCIEMTGPASSHIVNVPMPVCGDNDILVKVKYTGICHSEYYPWLTAKPGDRFGHETVGRVAAVGKNVVGWKIGDRITGLGGGGRVTMTQELQTPRSAELSERRTLCSGRTF